MKKLFPSLALALLLFSACGSDGPDRQTYSSSFEKGFEGWTANGADLEVGNTVIPWSIERTQDRASDGDTSVRLYLNNFSDAGKIWIERQFIVNPDNDYHVNISYDFATQDWGNFNLFTIITGVSAARPQSGGDLTYQGTTGNGSGTDVGYVWLKKNFEITAHPAEDGSLYVTIGVWGTFEAARTYYVDNVKVTFERL